MVVQVSKCMMTSRAPVGIGYHSYKHEDLNEGTNISGTELGSLSTRVTSVKFAKGLVSYNSTHRSDQGYLGLIKMMSLNYTMFNVI